MDENIKRDIINNLLLGLMLFLITFLSISVYFLFAGPILYPDDHLAPQRWPTTYEQLYTNSSPAEKYSSEGIGLFATWSLMVFLILESILIIIIPFYRWINRYIPERIIAVVKKIYNKNTILLGICLIFEILLLPLAILGAFISGRISFQIFLYPLVLIFGPKLFHLFLKRFEKKTKQVFIFLLMVVAIEIISLISIVIAIDSDYYCGHHGHRVDCFARRAITLEDPTVCNKNPPWSTDKEYCLVLYDLVKNDPLMCEKVSFREDVSVDSCKEQIDSQDWNLLKLI